MNGTTLGGVDAVRNGVWWDFEEPCRVVEKVDSLALMYACIT